jgi:TIR domain
MQVFISWSGETSRVVAKALRSWLPQAIQQVDPWMSEEEIKSGTRWGDAVATSLDQSHFGLICVTQSNQHNPWLLFEAGAIAKQLRVARVVPICINLASSDITGPLAGYQAVSLDHDGMNKLARDINAACERPMSRSDVDEVFESMWSRLDKAVTAAKMSAESQDSGAGKELGRSEDEMLSELIDRVRELERVLSEEVIRRLRRLDTTEEPERRRPTDPWAVRKSS